MTDSIEKHGIDRFTPAQIDWAHAERKRRDEEDWQVECGLISDHQRSMWRNMRRRKMGFGRHEHKWLLEVCSREMAG